MQSSLGMVPSISLLAMLSWSFSVPGELSLMNKQTVPFNALEMQTKPLIKLKSSVLGASDDWDSSGVAVVGFGSMNARLNRSTVNLASELRQFFTGEVFASSRPDKLAVVTDCLSAGKFNSGHCKHRALFHSQAI